MLVLSRKEGERILIGNDIVVTIVRVSGDKVRVGVEAPSDVLVLRGELEVRTTPTPTTTITEAASTDVPDPVQ